jgi:hypothetical protein
MEVALLGKTGDAGLFKLHRDLLGLLSNPQWQPPSDKLKFYPQHQLDLACCLHERRHCRKPDTGSNPSK